MDKARARKVYEKLDREELINILINSRIEIENMKKYDEQQRKMKKLVKRVKKAIKFIDLYTCKRKYMTDNDKELLLILEKGRSTVLNEE